MAENYYLILGISPQSSLADIKAAYRRLAKELHPDRSGGDRASFQSLQEAYSVLGDPRSRRAYDRRLRQAEGRPRPIRVEVGDRFQDEPVEPLIPRSRFEGRYRWPDTTPSSGRLFDEIRTGIEPLAAGRHRLAKEVRLSPKEARDGGTIRLQVVLPVACPACAPSGWPGRFFCRLCRGAGFLPAPRTFTVDYPAGTRDQDRYELMLGDAEADPIRLSLRFRVD